MLLRQPSAFALATQERTVGAAFAASEKAIAKAEEAQKEYNRAIGTLQNDVVSLKESRSQSTGNSGGMKDVYGYVFGIVMAIVAILTVVFTAIHK